MRFWSHHATAAGSFFSSGGLVSVSFSLVSTKIISEFKIEREIKKKNQIKHLLERKCITCKSRMHHSYIEIVSFIYFGSSTISAYMQNKIGNNHTIEKLSLCMQLFWLNWFLSVLSSQKLEIYFVSQRLFTYSWYLFRL